MTQEDIRQLEAEGKLMLELSSKSFEITLEDAEVVSEDIPGWSVASDGKYTVALDITLSEALKQEGIARELVNRIQNLRKNKGFEVTDQIEIKISSNPFWDLAIESYSGYIQVETLARELQVVTSLEGGDAIEVYETQGEIFIEK